MKLLDGTILANEIKKNLKSEIAVLKKGGQINFAGVIVGEDPASRLYVNRKRKSCEEVGINMQTIELGGEISQKALNETLETLSNDKNIHAILLQLPLPKHLNAREAISKISPEKDVDGLTAQNFGYLATEEPRLVPCTARGILHILKSYGIPVAGQDICVIGRSNIVGKPVSLLLTSQNATVTLCHSKTKNLAKHTKTADIVISAAGVANLVTADMIKTGAAIIDVGTNRKPDGKLCGDVDFPAVSKKAAAVTPVPGGVGPLTIAFLLSNIVQAYRGKHVQ